ncbi:two component transcriptional regulator, LuxR family [Methylophaga aminisulfidivorans MP]|jgi:DNA-binding NarL/FixJ family response regulator|uniref:Two component transcriptional regulator, LuxR family n=1 Tax=Methylophaga aminisulfidivorans MP TaxID=1026882 RepID=F5T3B1_9GAMM|nr:response regulator transcription factor [Methylophaga aminisulfidivorans]EGL53603.1 two component transcriptional regulator, LuxR family [Methylophaga aminisulfidivorans MP]
MITVILVDEHHVVRAGIKRLIEEQNDILVIAETNQSDQLPALYEEYQPDVFIIDMNTAYGSTLNRVNELTMTYPSARVMIFSNLPESFFANEAIQSGAKAYIRKTSTTEELLLAIRSVAAGKTYLSVDIAEKLALKNVADDLEPSTILTPREFEIFRLLAEGMEVESIAKELKISLKTMANYQTQLKQKLNIATPIQLVRLALKHHVITLNE